MIWYILLMIHIHYCVHCMNKVDMHSLVWKNQFDSIDLVGVVARVDFLDFLDSLDSIDFLDSLDLIDS